MQRFRKDGVLRLFRHGLRQFGAAVSATGRFGDGGRKCIMRKKCVFEIL